MDQTNIPYITPQQMLEVDRLMVDVYGIQLIQMMEVAGRQLARLSLKRFLDGDPRGKKVLILAGSGGNGGGALASARVLHNWGVEVQVVLSKSRGAYSGVIQHQIEILEAMSVPLLGVGDLGKLTKSDLILDGIIGYSLRGAPEGAPAEMIRWANGQSIPILALDLPSGLDPTSGEAKKPTIRAAATMTLALPKIGFRSASPDYLGELYLADIGVPPGLYASPTLGIAVGPIFHQEEILSLSSPNR